MLGVGEEELLLDLTVGIAAVDGTAKLRNSTTRSNKRPEMGLLFILFFSILVEVVVFVVAVAALEEEGVADWVVAPVLSPIADDDESLSE